MTSGVGLAERLERYREIESERERPLIVYATSPRQAAGGSIASDVIPEFLDQLATLPRSCQAVDVLIASNGGDPNTAWRIVSLIRERVEKLGVLIRRRHSALRPDRAGADEVLMHPNGTRAGRSTDSGAEGAAQGGPGN
jgi:hypothetical protein